MACADFAEAMRQPCSYPSSILIEAAHHDSNRQRQTIDGESEGSQSGNNFTAYIAADDGDGDGSVSISHRYDSAA
jgi:hypothetical protein